MEDKDDGVVALAMEDNDEKPEFKNSNGVKDVPPPLEVGRPAAPASDFVPPADLRDVRRFGTTFSLVELRRRNIEWRAALRASRELGLNALRVSACWADIEIDEGAFDFEELDEVLGLCGELGYEVLLTVGVKAPRPVQHDAWGWTDYHIPDWAEPDDAPADLASDERLCARALAYVRELVAHVGSDATVFAWQVENEPFERSGRAGHHLTSEFVGREVLAVREADPRLRPVVISTWCFGDLRSAAAVAAIRHADVVGLDVYARIKRADADAPASPWTDASRASAASAMTSSGGPTDLRTMRRCVTLPVELRALARSVGRDAWITESQAEPWPPAKFDVETMRWLVANHTEAGFSAIFLWGFEWWYDVKERKKDPKMWEAVKEEAAKFLAGPPPPAGEPAYEDDAAAAKDESK